LFCYGVYPAHIQVWLKPAAAGQMIDIAHSAVPVPVPVPVPVR
jgi:hypothetical protein